MIEPRRPIFLFGTMRSGSTLLTAILCSHPGILGYGETHVIYDGPGKLRELANRICKAHGIAPDEIGPRRLLDKLLHDGLLRDPGVLAAEPPACLFLLREPRPTLRSLVHHLGSTLDDAFLYYQARLATLERYTEAFPGSFFLTYEELTADPDRTLAALTAFLGLVPSLTPEYRLQPLHDVKGVGDRSEAILAGRVLANPRDLTVELPDARLREAEVSYERCRTVLSSTCRSA